MSRGLSEPVERLLDVLRGRARKALLPTIVLIGVVCGFLAVALHELIEVLSGQIVGRVLDLPDPSRIALLILVPTLTGAALAFLIGRFAQGAGGANLARVRRAYHGEPHLLSWRVILATFFLTPVSLASGVPLGPESPTVVVCSGIAGKITRWLRFPRRIVHGMIPVGTAAGIAAIFNTPITGVVFALEEILGTARRGVLGGAIVASVAAAVVQKSLLGRENLLQPPTALWSDLRELAAFAILGALAGLVTGLSIRAMAFLRRTAPRRVRSWPLRAAIAGALVGGLGIISPDILGVGYGPINGWLAGEGTIASSSVAFAAKTIGFIVAVGGGLIGGTFAPSLFAGAALGSAVGHTAGAVLPAPVDPGAFALVGMGSFFAGLFRNPISSVLIVVELTRDYDLIVPLMLSIALASSISRRIAPRTLVEIQMSEEGFTAPIAGDSSSNMRIADVMSGNITTLQTGMSILDAARHVSGTRHHLYPVVSSDGSLISIVTAGAINDAAREGLVENPIDSIAIVPTVAPRTDDSLETVLQALASRGVNRCPVVTPDGLVAGMLTPTDILRARLSGILRDSDHGDLDELV